MIFLKCIIVSFVVVLSCGYFHSLSLMNGNLGFGGILQAPIFTSLTPARLVTQTPQLKKLKSSKPKSAKPKKVKRSKPSKPKQRKVKKSAKRVKLIF